MSKHTPVFLTKVLEVLGDLKGKKIVDATVGEGGYTRAFLERGAKVLAIDIDPKQTMKLKKTFSKEIENNRLLLKTGNFAYLDRLVKNTEFYPADAVVFDLGLSWDQLSSSGRGFSYKNLDEPLDMRFNQKFKNTAADLLNYLPEEKLFDVIVSFSEEPYAHEIVKEIQRQRRKKKFKKVGDLVEVIERVVPKRFQEKALRRVFQALRIAVNNELENLRKGLKAGLNVLKPEGLLLFLTFHPTEDRIVKRFGKENRLKEIFKYTGKPWNKSFERSATLRVFKPNHGK